MSKLTGEAVIYRDIKFLMVENLRGMARSIAEEKGITSGLVLVKTRINSSPPEYDIERVSGSPIDAIRKLAADEDIDLDQALKTGI